MNCPHCGGSHIRSSSLRTAGDLVFSLLGKMAVRCRTCRHRFRIDKPNGFIATGLYNVRVRIRRHNPMRTVLFALVGVLVVLWLVVKVS